jgi:hypothetical protein
MKTMRYLPCKELTEALISGSYPKCCSFKTIGSIVRYDPKNGYIPRGFCGAFGKLSDIALVLVINEPGNPPSDGTQEYDMSMTPMELIEDSARGVFRAVKDAAKTGDRTIHGNIATILNECWPGLTLEEQYTRTWMTESVLCSAPKSTGPIPRIVEKACAERYLCPQLALLPNRFVVALGGKTQRRMSMMSLPASFMASAPGKPEGPKERARKSWGELGIAFREYLRKNG